MKYITDEERWAFDDGCEAGAAVAFGLLGMADAIRRHHPCACGEHDWRWIPGRNDDVCDRCGISGDEFDATQRHTEEP